jgi:ribose transport system ATP-binding protein
MRGIGKRFPGVIALDNVTLEVGAGEVVALCGEILVDGVAVKINNVTVSMKLRVAFIHQELNVLDNLDVAANVFLGREPKNALGLIDLKKIHADTEPLLKRLGLDLSSRTLLEKLSIAQKQMVEIAKALSLNSRIIIMDEPTSSLTLTETDRLLELVCELSAQGVSVIYISHRLGEVEHCADRVVVLRDGKNAGELPQAEVSHDRIVSLMVGREIKSSYTASTGPKTPGFFKVRNARSSRYPAKTVEFDATRGEILGFAGLVGAGRSEIVKAMVGLDTDGGAEVTIGDEKISIHSPADAIGHGIFLVPEDRRGEGLVTGMSVRENTTLPSLKKYSTLCLISHERERKVTDEQIKSLKIKTPGGEALVLNLSGGNQQKVVLGKWLSMNPKVMILDEPTRGIDVGAKAEIYRLMRELADRGGVILMISSDMEEVLNVSDRVAVMHEGKITGILERADCNEENVMNLAVGKTIAAAKSAVN